MGAMIKDRVGSKNDNKEEKERDNKDEQKEEINDQRNSFKPLQTADNIFDDERRIEEIREEERAKLTIIQQQLKDDFDNKLESIRTEIENDTDLRLRKELTV